MKILVWFGAALAALLAGIVLIGRPLGDRQTASAVVILAGQSNALGFGLRPGDLPPAARAPDPRVMIWDGDSFVPLQPGVNTGSPGAPHAWGPEVEFARRWRTDHPDGVLYIVKHARGSTSLAADAARPDWSPATRELYTETQAEIAEARAALDAEGGGSRVAAILWVQGEQDAVEPAKAAAYRANLVNLFKGMRRDWAGGRIPILFSQVKAESGFEYGETVRAAQHAVDQADDFAAMVPTDAVALQPDRIHFSGAGQIRLGGAFYDLYASAPPPLR